ncbi:MAG: hypothetical protein RMJ43_15775 [Chloroherpetonaceae bacterium]|nr:hypothetical protein [Chthonomonadaceae bacterium]MDW8209293.1 hypothetical protein [Chloroherpetonaceae bacterium]
MQRIDLNTEYFLVTRTGLAFYDAARVIGVAQLFFGTAEAEVEDRGYAWAIRGLARDRHRAENRLWIGQRLRRFEKKPNNYERLQKVDLNNVWEKWRTYFRDPFAGTEIDTDGATGLMDAACLQGTRGLDPSQYAHFAAQKGSTLDQPEPELLAALLGLSHAARVNNELFLLPVFGDDLNSPPGVRYPMPTARYWNYERRFQHEGGEQIAAVWAMLSMLECLYDVRLPVADFAYNRVGRPIFHSGTMGAERLCRLWRRGARDVLIEVSRFLQNTSGEKAGHGADLARALAAFALNPDAVSLERVVRMKARTMADEEQNDAKKAYYARMARMLWQRPEILEEIQNMINTQIPAIPESLCNAVRDALNPKKGEKGWIGGYMKLENATTIHRFVEEAQRLISRARMDRDLYYGPEIDGTTLTALINDLAPSPQRYRAFRAAFLLRVLQVRTGSKATEPDAPDAAAPGESDSNNTGDETNGGQE